MSRPPPRRRASVHRLPMAHPGDTAALQQALRSGAIAAASIVAILGKTEGNGCVNDFTRAYASDALRRLLGAALGVAPAEVDWRVALIMSGGTEGGLCPHFTVFCREPSAGAAGGAPALAIGTGFTREFLPEEIGRLAQIEATGEAVAAAMHEAGIEHAADVHYVQIKCPLLTRERVGAAARRGRSCATEDTYDSMGLSRGASALGVALALGEIAPGAAGEASVGRDFTLYSGRASTSAGIELMRNEIMVLGNSRHWDGSLRIAHGVMEDALDLEAARGALAALGISAVGQLVAAERARIAAVLCKAEAARSGEIRGRRHIMLEDSDIHATRHARALVGGVLAGLFGDTRLFVSGGAEHQGPDGGGPVAVIASC
jgi:cyanuric acid amidohydrolase